MRPPAICPQADLRNIYYGLLGPQAKSITYVLDGQRHTLGASPPGCSLALDVQLAPDGCIDIAAVSNHPRRV